VKIGRSTKLTSCARLRAFGGDGDDDRARLFDCAMKTAMTITMKIAMTITMKITMKIAMTRQDASSTLSDARGEYRGFLNRLRSPGRVPWPRTRELF